MPTIPAALLKQIYKRGSLHNLPDGYSFKMRNHLATANIVGLRLRIDNASVFGDQIAVEQNGATMTADQITPDNPLRFASGIDTIVIVRGTPLAPGKHNLEITADTREIGSVVIAVADEC